MASTTASARQMPRRYGMLHKTGVGGGVWGITLALLFLGMLPRLALAHGGEDHSHGEEKTAVASSAGPRIEARSDVFELVGVPSASSGGTLRVDLSDYASNAPVSGAQIEMTVGDQTVVGTPSKALYEFKAPWVTTPGRYPLTFSVNAGDKSDLLIGELNIPEPPAVQIAHPSVWDHIWPDAPKLPRLPQWAALAALAVAGLLTGIALLLPKIRHPLLGLAIISGAVSAIAAAVSTSAPPPTGIAAKAVLDVPDVSRRLEDGSVFVPKTTQRLLGVTTEEVSSAQTTQKTVRIIGQIVPDPNNSGIVQALLTGRVEPPEAGFPAVGSRVNKGDVLGYLHPRVELVDQSDIRQTQADLDRQIALAESKLRRIEPLEGGAVPRGQVDDARIELQELRKRRTAIKPVLGERQALLAPASGVISQANVTGGQVVEAQTLIFQIVDPSNLWVEALAYDPVLAGSIEKSGKTALATTADGRKVTLEYSGRSLTLRQQAVPLRFKVKADDTPLNVGEPVTVHAPIDRQVSAIAVPRASVVRAANGQSVVWSHVSAERFETRLVQTTPVDADRVGITAGLEPGARLVVRGAELINQVR